MRIYANIDAVQDRYGAERGVPRYSLEFASTMERIAPGRIDRWLLRDANPIPPTLLDLLPTGRLSYAADRSLARPDVIHSLAPFQHISTGLRVGDVFADRLRGPRTKLVSTLYDLIPLIYSEEYLADPRARAEYWLALEIIRSSDLVLAISESTARDAVRLLHLPPSKVVVVGTGVPDAFDASSVPAQPAQLLARELPALKPGFLLYVGGLDFRKNMEGLIRAYALLSPAIRRQHQLALVCKLTSDGKAALQTLIRELGVEGSVVLTNAVSDRTLRALYAETALFVFPSLYEGFGLPVVEALRSGAPVVVGDNSSLRDIVPLADARFDAGSPRDMARVITRTLSDEHRRLRTIREIDHTAYTWENVVSATLDASRFCDRVERPEPSRALGSPW